MRKYSVYIHINRINRKKYIGISRNKPEYRWRKGEGYKRQPHFYSAIQKYGWDNFDHIVIEVDSEEEMFKLEQEYIAYYQTTIPEKGYNISLGGETGGYLGKDCYSKEYIKKQYAKHSEEIKTRNKKYYDENKEKVKERCRMYRDLHKEEVKLSNQKYRENNKERDRENHRLYYQLHKEYLDKKNKENYRRWYYAHKDEINAKNRLKRKKDYPIVTLW